MAKRLRLSIALVLLASAQACSDDGSWPGLPGTCTPSAHTTPDPGGASAFCSAFYGALCDRAFSDCVAEVGLSGYFPGVAECRSALELSCASGSSDQWYDAPCGEACVAFVRAAPCRAFEGAEPQVCTLARGLLPPACIATISPGTLTDTIASGDPVYDDGHARTYCSAFAAGQSVVIETSAPPSGTPVGDTMLYLLDPAGVEIASDDDGGDGLYSRIAMTIPASGEYRIVVRGYSSYALGTFQLTVTAP
jgi:hypothetical protein